MHLLVRETRTLDEAEAAVDLGQSPAGLVFISFSDSDLSAAAAAWLDPDPATKPAYEPVPPPPGATLPFGLRLASLARLRHPLSVDLYLERTASHARAIVLRLLGGMEYWRYGAEELGALCRREGIALAVVPGCERADPRLAELSTVPESTRLRIESLLRAGGAPNTRLALLLAAHEGGLCAPPEGEGVAVPAFGRLATFPTYGDDRWPVAAIVFYRSHLLAGDTAPIHALGAALSERRMRPRALFVPSLKDAAAAAFIADRLRSWRPAVVLNATSFSARTPGPDGDASPLDAADAPVLQLVLANAARDAWAGSPRGLGPQDMAMQVVLPELDGRLATAAISFKAEDLVPALEFTRRRLAPDADGIALAADRAAAWARLAATPRAARRIALVLPDYPGRPGQVGHAVGLDTPASLAAILQTLRAAGYDLGPAALPDADALSDALCRAEPTPALPLPAYAALLATLPAPLRAAIAEAWGAPEHDPAVAAGHFAFRHLRRGHALLAVQPDRGAALDRSATYHDPQLPPRHAHVAFHLWLRLHERSDALVMLGAHGTLEWLPGKPVAPSAGCAPSALLAGLPVIYPFIVNNPGEAAAARRRLGAVTIGHLTPPMRPAAAQGEAATLERLIDEYTTADGLDPRRAATLRAEILERAERSGLLEESKAGLCPDPPKASAFGNHSLEEGHSQGAALSGVQRQSLWPSLPPAAPDDDDPLARLDAYLCDVKDLQLRDGLHVFGRPPHDPAALHAALARGNPAADHAGLSARLDACAPAESSALLAALDGRFVQPGPGGAPTRGRADVLPTGRNIAAIDPRGMPTRAACTSAAAVATLLLLRHRQEQGDWPRALVIDLWGSSAMRTGGEDLALALHLLGATPLWDAESARVTGVEILPLAVLDRPRVDVTLRISGLFRDAFETQLALFDDAVRAVAARDEAADFNPLAAAAAGLDGDALHAATARIYGPAAGQYGAGVAPLLDRGAWQGRAALGESYLAASECAWGPGRDGAPDRAGLERRVAAAEAFVHVQDHAETDILDGPGFVAHEGGFAAAAASLGAAPALYHADTSREGTPRVRATAAEVARVVRGRAANPDWVRGMMAHGYRGAAEIARGADALFGFAATLPDRFDRQFDLVFEATLGTPDVDAFLARENPAARAALAARLDEALSRGLWRPARNAVAATLAEAAGR
ncbi:MAG: cobaltochelatase subunit CobN [Janthinobacterium lividum]